MVRIGKSTHSAVSPPFTRLHAIALTGMVCLVVLSADLKEPMKKGVVYVEIKLPRGVQVLTQTVESTKLQWNRTFEL